MTTSHPSRTRPLPPRCAPKAASQRQPTITAKTGRERLATVPVPTIPQRPATRPACRRDPIGASSSTKAWGERIWLGKRMRSVTALNASCRFCQVSTITSPRPVQNVRIGRWSTVCHNAGPFGIGATVKLICGTGSAHTPRLAPIGRACYKIGRRRKVHECLNHAQQSLLSFSKHPRAVAVCDGSFCAA